MAFFDALKDAGVSAPVVPVEATESPVEATERVWEGSTTPSGIEIRFSPEPREYQIALPGHSVDHLDTWVTVPSVTHILDVLNKPLTYYGYRVGLAAVTYLWQNTEETDLRDILFKGNPDRIISKDDTMLAELASAHRRDPNRLVKGASDRGTSVHTAFDQWAIDGTVPDPQFFPEEERLYVQGLVNFLTDAKLEPVASEVTVGSKSDGYAGRYDLLAYYGGEEVCTHLTPKKGKREALEPGLYLFDLKTSSGVYPGSHFRQLAAYAKASVECGYDEPDDCAVINVQKDGRYQVKVSNATYEDFDVVHQVWKSDQRLKGK